MRFRTASDLLRRGEADTYSVKGVIYSWKGSTGTGKVQVVDIHRILSGKVFDFGRSHWTGLRFPWVGERVDVVFVRGGDKLLKVRQELG